MKKLVALLAVMAVAGLPSHAGAAGPKDYAKGSGIDQFGNRFSFNAESDPSGGSPKGTMTFETPSFKVSATVTCLMVFTTASGPWAGISGDIIKKTGTVAGDGLYFNVLDFGGNDSFLEVVEPESRPAQTCPFGAASSIAEGEIVLIDE